MVTDEIVQVAFHNCTISSVIQHVFYRRAPGLGWTLLGLVLVARVTNILSCFVWSRGRVTKSRSQGRRFKSGAGQADITGGDFDLDGDICRVRDVLVKANVSILSKGEGDKLSQTIQVI